MTPSRSRAPFWFQLAIAAALALALRLVVGALASSPPPPRQLAPPLAAFWFAVIFVAELIWKGVEVAGKVTLVVLRWMVLNLYFIVTKIGNALTSAGHLMMSAFKKAWDFTRALYDDVLKPAWKNFWKWFDKARTWLERTFTPILKWLRELRDNLVRFYKTFVRPWLDLIEVTRKGLRVLSALGVRWARALDARLAKIEDLVEKPFRYVLAKLNEVINVVNLIMTADGLFQRVALVRSIVRDYKYVWNTMRKAYDRPLSGGDKTTLKETHTPPTIASIDAAAVRLISTGEGPKSATFEEMYQEIRLRVRAG